MSVLPFNTFVPAVLGVGTCSIRGQGGGGRLWCNGLQMRSHLSHRNLSDRVKDE